MDAHQRLVLVALLLFAITAIVESAIAHSHHSFLDSEDFRGFWWPKALRFELYWVAIPTLIGLVLLLLVLVKNQ